MKRETGRRALRSLLRGTASWQAGRHTRGEPTTPTHTPTPGGTFSVSMERLRNASCDVPADTDRLSQLVVDAVNEHVGERLGVCSQLRAVEELRSPREFLEDDECSSSRAARPHRTARTTRRYWTSRSWRTTRFGRPSRAVCVCRGAAWSE